LLGCEEWLKSLTEHWPLILGPLIVLVVLLARRGLLGLLGATGEAEARA